MHSFDVTLIGPDDVVVVAQVAQLHIGMTLAAAFEETYSLKIEDRLRTDMLILRLPVEQEWNSDKLEDWILQQSASLFNSDGSYPSSIFDRAGDRSVHIVGSTQGEHFLTANVNTKWRYDPLDAFKIDKKSALRTIRQAELNSILENSRAVLACPHGGLFKAPSGQLVGHFIRVGNIQHSRDAIHAIFFWLLPYLKRVDAILTDTWSISSIAFNISRLAALYFGGLPRRVEMMQEYNDGSTEARSSARKIIQRLDREVGATRADGRELLCLISATHSGSLAGHLKEICSTSRISLYPRYVAIFALGKTKVDVIHDLSSDPRFRIHEDEASAHGEPMLIDPRVYFPLNFRDTVIEIDKSVAERSRAFFDRFANTGVVEVHKTHSEGTGKSRHHSIHINSTRLLSVPEFVKNFEQSLKGVEKPPLAIISPPHAAGVALARHAELFFQMHDKVCKAFFHPNLNPMDLDVTEDDRELKNLLNHATSKDLILIIDDVCITGARLSQFQRYLRTGHFVGRVHYLVAVVRPSKKVVWENLERYIGGRGKRQPRNTLQYIDFILMPDWRRDKCPWCAEKRLLEKWSQEKPLPEYLLNRLERLSASEYTGIRDALFLEVPGLDPLKLGPDSFFTKEESGQADVFAAVASAIQYLRTDPANGFPPLGKRRFPISTVLNYTDYLTSKWTDSILRASFFRAALIEELTYVDAEPEGERTTAISDLITDPGKGEHNVFLEAFLAAGLSKCQLDLGSDKIAKLISFGQRKTVEYLIDRLQGLKT